MKVPLGYLEREIPFAHRMLSAISIPWGDVSTAYHSTKIPNITVYTAMPKPLIRALKLSRPFFPVLGYRIPQFFLKTWVGKYIKGPEAEQRKRGRTYLWGRVTDPVGRVAEGTLETPEGYTLTVSTALEAVRRVESGAVPPGVWTPSQAFGADFITHFRGTILNVQPVTRTI